MDCGERNISYHNDCHQSMERKTPGRGSNQRPPVFISYRLSYGGSAQIFSIWTGIADLWIACSVLGWVNCFPRPGSGHRDRISRCVEKQSATWKEYYAKYWFRTLLESMDTRFTDRRDITEIMFPKVGNQVLESYNTPCVIEYNLYLETTQGK